MFDDLAQQAIKSALLADWPSAIKFNKDILKKKRQDIEALCRLARALTETGEKKEANKIYRQVLKLDKFNAIAKKGLKRLSVLRNNLHSAKQTHQINPNLFLEEPGKTKVVSLIKLTQPKMLLRLNIGAKLKLFPKKHSIFVYNSEGSYLGKIPDDLSMRLIILIKRGNQYEAVVKSVDSKKLVIFIKEVKKSKKNANFPSFPIAKDQYHSFTPQNFIKREPISEIETSFE